VTVQVAAPACTLQRSRLATPAFPLMQLRKQVCGSVRALALVAVLLSLTTPRAFADINWFELDYWQSVVPVQHTEELLPDDAIILFDTKEELLEAEPEEEQTTPPLQFEDEYVEAWTLQWLPAGLIYHSYMAGPHEPRMGLNAFSEDSRILWDATLGGRVGLVQFGNGDPVTPRGYQLDFYGAAIARLDVDNQQDLDSTDYVFGLPLTWGDERLQFKFGYAHLSSHLGDELAYRDPGALAERINYVRDSVVFGTSYYPYPVWRVYGEAGYAFHTSGGAEPVDTQFGSEFSRPGPTGDSGTPFLAFNGRLRQELDFGGDVTVQIGWLRRGIIGQTFRFGLHYYNGKSSQFQFYSQSEEQTGIGLWYDF
jgi:hypothetical protein